MGESLFKMKTFVALLALCLCLGVSQAANATESLEDYVRQNQRQYDARVKQNEDELAHFRDSYNKQLRAIDVQADLLQVKIEYTSAILDPIELIDSWHRQCVQNYSGNLPTIASMRTSMTSCSTTAKNNINSILSSAQSTSDSMKSYYRVNLKNLLTDCEKKYGDSHDNYTICVTKAINTANSYTVNMQKSFVSHMQQAECSADNRINQAWECSFNIVYSTSSDLSVTLRLVNDCIANERVCGFGCTASAGCPHYLYSDLSEKDLRNTTIKNPFINWTPQSCVQVYFRK